MNLTTEVFGDVMVVHAPDELGAELAGQLSAYLSSRRRRRIVFDLDGTELIDSAGLTALLDAQDQLRQKGGQMRIATSNPTNRKILEITRLDRQLEVFSSVIEAVKSFQ
ncbi:MAG TPA: anti-sigma factor antagonist [Planctomycetaceae bacterium]|nr:anti-sigma factor antagonist [Planctomycetaceae bacterium]HIQ20322.1 anti-sigma factor antagonist [Planctomycetota bacterium]